MIRSLTGVILASSLWLVLPATLVGQGPANCWECTFTSFPGGGSGWTCGMAGEGNASCSQDYYDPDNPDGGWYCWSSGTGECLPEVSILDAPGSEVVLFAGLLPVEDLFDTGISALAIALSGPAVSGCALQSSLSSGGDLHRRT